MKSSPGLFGLESFFSGFVVYFSAGGCPVQIEFCGREGLEQGQNGVLRCGARFPLAFEFLLFLLEGRQFGIFHQRLEFVRLGVFSIRIPEDAGQPAGVFLPC